MENSKKLLNKINTKEAVISIIGLGYVGLPLALSFAESGFNVIGLDIDRKKIEKLYSKESYIGHIKNERIAKVIANNKFKPSDNFAESLKADCLIICVPTPLSQYREPDLSYVTGTMTRLEKYFKDNQILILESTTYPGTTNEILRPYIENKGFIIGENYFLVFSPEREDPANPEFSTKTIAKVLGGHTKKCTEIGVALYSSIIDKVVPVSSTQAAELTKLLENIYRAVNIGLVNELKIVADKMGLDIYEIIDAAATKPFGFTPFYPGPGIGGHCIPVDPFYLTWKARAFGLHTRFIELAGEINCSMPTWVVQKIFYALNSKGLALKNSKILILGLAYKKNVDDMRESPSVEIISLLKKEGVIVDYSDPYILKFPKIRKADFDLKSVEINKDNIKNYDAVVLLTNHDNFDYELIAKNASLIIDTRGVFKNLKNVVKA